MKKRKEIFPSIKGDNVLNRIRCMNLLWFTNTGI